MDDLHKEKYKFSSWRNSRIKQRHPKIILKQELLTGLSRNQKLHPTKETFTQKIIHSL